jgi:hypothetical protein
MFLELLTRRQNHYRMGLYQNQRLLKIIIAPSLKGVLIFSDFLPLGSGQKVDENHNRYSFDTAPGC